MAAIEKPLTRKLSTGSAQVAELVALRSEYIAKAVDARYHFRKRFKLAVVKQPCRHQGHTALAGYHARHRPTGVIHLSDTFKHDAFLPQCVEVGVSITEYFIGIGALYAF